MKTQVAAQAQQHTPQSAQPVTRAQAAADAAFVDHRPEAAAQLRLQAQMDQSPRVVQLAAQMAMMDRSPRVLQGRAQADRMNQRAATRHRIQPLGDAHAQPVQRQEASPANHTGLPDRLKAGVESLSDMSMNHVRVRYNSSKPAQLNALAYAQGSEIHVGPGQEKHLPHEAWHVVQQAQGRVKPTMQMAGVTVNDDGRLEREADVMGEKASTGVAQHMGTGGAHPQSHANVLTAPTTTHPVQMRVFPHATGATVADKDRYRVQFAAVEARIDREVVAARAQALNWGDFVGDGNARLALWAATAQKYFEAPAVEPRFIHAYFGYAIEELATEQLPASMSGLSIHLQVAAGHTRPDIVLKDGSVEVAWLDITAEDSVNHILGKQGAGWRTRPFVSEILYDSLALPEVLQAINNPMLKEVGGYYAAKNRIMDEERKAKIAIIRYALTTLRDSNDWKTGVGNAKTKRNETRAELKGLGMDLGQHADIAAKGALAFADVNSGPFGYGGAKPKSRIDVARAFVHDQAQPGITRRVGTMNIAWVTDIRARLNARGASVSRTKYLADLRVDELANHDLSEHVRVGIALDFALKAQAEAGEHAGELDAQHHGDGRTAAVVTPLNDHLDTLPANPTFHDLRTWSNALEPLAFDAELLLDLIAKADEFEQYLNQRHDDYLNDMSIEEFDILMALKADLIDYEPCEAADEYMEANP